METSSIEKLRVMLKNGTINEDQATSILTLFTPNVDKQDQILMFPSCPYHYKFYTEFYFGINFQVLECENNSCGTPRRKVKAIKKFRKRIPDLEIKNYLLIITPAECEFIKHVTTDLKMEISSDRNMTLTRKSDIPEVQLHCKNCGFSSYILEVNHTQTKWIKWLSE